MTELTRRQMRELERAGEVAPGQINPPVPLHQGHSTEERAPIPTVSTESSERPLSRREMRLRESGQLEALTSATAAQRAAALSKSLAQQVVEPVVQAKNPEPPRVASRLGQPLPPVGSSRKERRASLPTEIQPVDVEEVAIPEQGPMGASYLGEPSTQSIVLDVAPEAISLPTDTGELFTTGSIAILPDTSGSTTGSLDGIDLDHEEAVTGVISVVDPVSAKDLIDERSPLGVVPSNVLRKGWWKPWAVGALSILMATAALFASLTILNAIGG